MQVINKNPFAIIASCGTGGNKFILPGQVAEVLGPHVDKISGRDFYAVIPGVIVCQNEPEQSGFNNFQVSEGHPLCMKAGEIEIHIWHYLDAPQFENCLSCRFNCEWDQQ